MSYKTEQESFWAGDFGDAYIGRNTREDSVCKRLGLWAQVIRHIVRLETVIEFGANIGVNLRALQILVPGLRTSAIEINQAAIDELSLSIAGILSFQQTMLRGF